MSLARFRALYALCPFRDCLSPSLFFGVYCPLYGHKFGGGNP